MNENPPPVLSEGGSYDKWRSDIQMWQVTTSLEPRRQALAVRTKLSGKVRELALRLDAADLNKENGMGFLLEKLDAAFKRKRKWDVSDKEKVEEVENNRVGEQVAQDPNISAAERARQRAAMLSAKLAAEGKYQTQPMSLLPSSVSNPVDQFKKVGNPALPQPLMAPKPLYPHQLPEVKKLESGGYFAEFNINDVAARQFLTKSSSQELVGKQSGAAVTLRGRYLSAEDKRKMIVSGITWKALSMMIQADVAAKVQVAVHKIMEVIRNYDKHGPDNSLNNFGLTHNQNQSMHHFVQDKLFVGLENLHPDFNMKEKLAGPDNTNFNFIVQQSGAKVFLRGKGSGFLEARSGRESFEALHIYISHPRQNGLEMARQLCENLIDTVRSKYDEWEVERLTQPRVLGTTIKHPAGMASRLVYPVVQVPQNRFHPPITQSNVPRGHILPNQFRQFAPRPTEMGNHFERFNHAPSLVNEYRPPFSEYAPVGDRIDQFLNNTHHNNAHKRLPYEDGRNKRRDDRNHSDNEQLDDSEDRHRSRDRHRGRSRERRRRSRNRTRSRSRTRSQSRSGSRERRRRSRSRNRQRSPRRSPEKTEERVKRRFTEEPKKRRKFSEDPKLLEKSKVEINRTSTDDLEAESNLPPPKLQFRSKKEPKTTVDPFMPPPPKPPTIPSLMPQPVGLPLGSKKLSIPTNDLFKAPPPISILKPQPKALKMGALSSLTAYDGDSDED